MLAGAFACDLTRVATFMWSRGTSPQHFPFLDIPDDAHHFLSHKEDAQSVQALTEINKFYAGQLAYLCAALDAVPERSGTMLDNTLILSGNSLSRGSTHDTDNIPLVLAGGAAGYFNMGRHLKYDGDINNRLLVSLCHYMGLENQASFGDMDTGSGPLDKLV